MEKNKTQFLIIRISPELKSLVEKYAKSKGHSLSRAVRDLIKKAL